MLRSVNSGRVRRRLVAVLSVLCLVLVPGIAVAGDVAWTQVGDDIDGNYGSRLGESVAISDDGNTVATKAPFTSGRRVGHVEVHYRDGAEWHQVGEDIVGETSRANDFGSSLAMSGDGSIVAIGGSEYRVGGELAGQVRVHSFDGLAWVQLGQDINGEAPRDLFGYSTALSSDGHTVAIGATGNDANGPRAGHVRVFAFDGSAWIQVGQSIEGEAAWDLFGSSVAMSSDGSTVAIGAVGNDANGPRAGHVRVFAFDGSNWVQRGQDIDGEAADGESGHSVAISHDGNTVVIGAWLADGPNSQNSGKVNVYGFDGAVWNQRGQAIVGEGKFSDLSGFAVAINAAGDTIAIGAPGNDASGPGAGQVRAFSYDGSAWLQVGQDLDGEAASNGSGESVAMSADGETIAIGAGSNRVNGVESGHVRVFSLADYAHDGPLQDGNIVYLSNAATGRYIDSDGVHADFNVDTSIAAQYDARWIVVDNNDGTWSLLNQKRSRYLDADGPGSDWNVNQSTKLKDDDIWQIIPQADNTFTLINTRHHRWLNEDSTHNVNMAETNTDATTHWVITPAN